MVARARVTCCDRPLLAKHGEHAKVVSDSLPPCVHRHNVTQLLGLLDMAGVEPCMAFHGCARNEWVAINERHCKQVPQQTPLSDAIWHHAFEFLSCEYPPVSTSVLSRNEVVKHSPQSRRNRIRNAFANIDKNGWSDAYARVKTFTKFETFPDATGEREMVKSARLIQHRSDEYCYTLARYLKPIEWKTLYKQARGKHRGQRLFAKGMTPSARGSWLDDAWESYNRPVALCADHSSYDAHLTIDKRRFEWAYYEKFCRSGRLRHLLSLQRYNRCKTANGIRYQMEATMCSGDYNTSLGDNVINLAILLYATRNVRCHILVDGDDSIIIMDQSDRPFFDNCFSSAGLTTKAEWVFEKALVDFCQSRFVQLAHGSSFVRNPYRVWSKSAYTCKTYPDHVWPRLVKAVGLCELACNRGVPVLQEYAKMLVRASGKARVLQHDLQELLAHRNVAMIFSELPVDNRARLGFFEAFGIPPQQQLALELWFSQAELPIAPSLGLRVGEG